MKYTFTGKKSITVINGKNVLLNQIACGDLVGGWIEGEWNLSQEGECFVYENGIVCGNARVYGNACISGDALVCGNARVYGDAIVTGDSIVSDYACVYGDVTISYDFNIGKTMRWNDTVR